MAQDKRHALITAATDGIGRAVAAKLLAHGWAVTIVGRDSQRCEATVRELAEATANEHVDALVADLSSLRATARACDAYLGQHQLLDFLMLNANTITHARVLTEEGFESNFALGYLSRVLMARKLEAVLTGTPRSQILTVVGRSLSRLDFDDLTLDRGFKSMDALKRWQWAMHLYTHEFNKRTAVPMNIYMPGIVKTKILAQEPQPTKTMIKLVYRLKGITVDQSANNTVAVVEDIALHQRRDCYYSVATLKPPPHLEAGTGDGEQLWDMTNTLIAPYI